MQRATIVSMAWGPDSETIPVPAAVRFPVELMPPPGFCPNDPATWPAVDGRLEYVDGRLLYMPPCGAVQQAVAASVAGVLDRWLDDHPDFFVGANEAGMMFGRDVRGAEGAVFRRDALGPISGGYSRVPPILAVEVAGREEGEPELRVKAAWYLSRGVRVVWLVLPATRDMVVMTPRARAGTVRERRFHRIRSCPASHPPSTASSTSCASC